jgi:hypothetical protein
MKCWWWWRRRRRRRWGCRLRHWWWCLLFNDDVNTETMFFLTVSIWRSLRITVFGTYQGASTIMRKAFYWKVALMMQWLVPLGQLVEWEFARVTEVLGANLPQWHFVHHKSQTTWTDPIWLGTEVECMISFLLGRTFRVFVDPEVHCCELYLSLPRMF